MLFTTDFVSNLGSIFNRFESCVSSVFNLSVAFSRRVSFYCTMLKRNILKQNILEKNLECNVLRYSGLTLRGYLSEISARSWQDLETILAKILTGSCHGIHFAMVRFYQESHVPKENFIVKSYLARANLKGSQQKINIYADLHC